MSSDRTLVVVGGGPAGVTAALQACELGAQVTLLEAGQIGGTSLNRGPAPVRTLARTARLARARRVLGRDRADGRRLHGRTEDLPDPRHRELPPGVELSRT
ncbi:MAG: FAD-dependent oxidoreductase [Streptosporangiaceae bacterium]